jgi:hypothetical protein
MNRILKYAITVAAIMSVTGLLALGGTSQAAVRTTAKAAPAVKVVKVVKGRPDIAAADGCDFPSGTSASLTTGPNGVAPTDGTIFTMPSGTSCYDLNLYYVSATDKYEGWLRNSSTGRWFACSEGWVTITAGYKNPEDPPYLCTDVLPGTEMAVVQASSTHHDIIVED